MLKMPGVSMSTDLCNDTSQCCQWYYWMDINKLLPSCANATSF